MPKAARVLAALKRDGWVKIRQRGSHRRLVKGPLKRTWGFHDDMELGTVQMTRVAKQIRLYIWKLCVDSCRKPK